MGTDEVVEVEVPWASTTIVCNNDGQLFKLLNTWSKVEGPCCDYARFGYHHVGRLRAASQPRS